MKENWKTKPISRTCEVLLHGGLCNCPTTKAYPAHPYGWMALCDRHTERHPEAFDLTQLIKQGETLSHGRILPTDITTLVVRV